MADKPAALKSVISCTEENLTEAIDELFPKCKIKSGKANFLNDGQTALFRSNGNVVDLLMSPNNNTSVLPCYDDKQNCRIMYQEGDEDLLGLDSPPGRKDSYSESAGSGGSCAEDSRKPEAKWVEAGAKEVYSQSRARAGRKRSGDDWGKKIKRVEAEAAPVRRPVKVYKETVFASEIKTLENAYRSTDPDVTVLDPMRPNYFRSSPEEPRNLGDNGGGAVSADTLSGSTVKNLAESLLMMSPEDTKLCDGDAGNTSDDSLASSSSAYLQSSIARESNGQSSVCRSSGSPDSVSPSSSPVARVIGSVPIAKYEGSPRRLAPRPRLSPAVLTGGSGVGSNSSVTYGNFLPRPGHPQRVIASIEPLDPLECKDPLPPVVELKDTKIDTTLEPVKDEMELGRESLSAMIPELGQVTDLLKDDPGFIQQPSLESMYEFSETRKVLEEFFGCPPEAKSPEQTDLSMKDESKSRVARPNGPLQQNQGKRVSNHKERSDVNAGIADPRNSSAPYREKSSRRVKAGNGGYGLNLMMRPNTASSASSLSYDHETLSTEDLGDTEVGLRVEESRNFTLSPETTECEDPSDLESYVCEDPENGEGEEEEEGSLVSSVAGTCSGPVEESMKSSVVSVMPVLEDGLSSGDEEQPEDHEVADSDGSAFVGKLSSASPDLLNGDQAVEEFLRGSSANSELLGVSGTVLADAQSSPTRAAIQREMRALEQELQARARARARAQRKSKRQSPLSEHERDSGGSPQNIMDAKDGPEEARRRTYSPDVIEPGRNIKDSTGVMDLNPLGTSESSRIIDSNVPTKSNRDDYETVVAGTIAPAAPPPPPAPFPHRLAPSSPSSLASSASLSSSSSSSSSSRCLGSLRRPSDVKDGLEALSDAESCSRDLRRSKVLRPDDFDEPLRERESNLKTGASPVDSSHGAVNMPDDRDLSTPVWVGRGGDPRKQSPSEMAPLLNETNVDDDDLDTDQETDRLLGQHRSDDGGFFRDEKEKDSSTGKKKGKSKEGRTHDPAVLIEGVLFRARYLGSTQLVCEGQPTKATRMIQAEEAVSRIKAPEGESQPSTEVDLFISTEKIMVLNTDLKEIMMDHALRSISYIADIGDLVVLMARRRITQTGENGEPVGPTIAKTPKMICHIFESEEAQFIAQSIGQAFHVAYVEFLKANGIEADQTIMKDMDYQEVLNSQEIFGDELQMFAKKENQKEAVVPKSKGEILGMVIVESGWGSMLPTVVVANLLPSGPAARCGLLNIGDQIIAINGVSLVGLPLSTCQQYIKNTKTQTVVKLTVVPCPPVVEVKIRRPDTKYQLGFSVQNGVICSLLRGGIAERGGVRVGHRIIEINNQSVVAVPHEKIVNLLATSTGEICMKTMPTSMFRLLTGQETPVYM